jgi:hypothetical protein
MKNTRPDDEGLYVLRDWIPFEKINKYNLNSNFSKGAVDFLKKNPSFINENIYKNPYAMHIIIERIKTETNNRYIEYLCENPEAIDLIENFINIQKELMPVLMEEYEDELELFDDDDDSWGSDSGPTSPESDFRYLMYYLSKNPKAVPLLKKHPEFINYHLLYDNHSKEAVDHLMKGPDFNVNNLTRNPFAIEILKQNFKTVDFDGLSSNPEAIFMLLANQHLINWQEFSKNTSRFAIILFKKNLHRLNKYYLSKNPSAIYLLEKHRVLIDWGMLTYNPSIFVIGNQSILENYLSKKQRNQFAWEYPRKYLILRRFVDLISETFYNPGYKWCKKLLLKKFNEN